MRFAGVFVAVVLEVVVVVEEEEEEPFTDSSLVLPVPKVVFSLASALEARDLVQEPHDERVCLVEGVDLCGVVVAAAKVSVGTAASTEDEGGVDDDGDDEVLSPFMSATVFCCIDSLMDVMEFMYMCDLL